LVGGHLASRDDIADDDAAPSELLSPLLEEWPDLMRLVLARLVGLADTAAAAAYRVVLQFWNPCFLG
jgi:hypothetical protein